MRVCWNRQTGTFEGRVWRRVRVQVPSLAPNKNESYDTIGIATFVLFLFSKMPVTQGFLAVGHKR